MSSVGWFFCGLIVGLVVAIGVVFVVAILCAATAEVKKLEALRAKEVKLPDILKGSP